MADSQNRRFPVDTLVLHHSTGPEFVNSTDLEVQDWFDTIGKNRGYAGYSRSYHDHPQRNKETFAQAHYALRQYTLDKNKYGYRLTPLMKDVWNCVAWHCSSWAGNQRSIGIETCGTYTNRKLSEKALMLIADKFRFKDKELKGKFYVNPHNAYIATICPGMITQQLPTLIDMINNPDKWNKKLFTTNNTTMGKNDTLYRYIQGKATLMKGSKLVLDGRKYNMIDEWGKTKAELKKLKADFENKEKTLAEKETEIANLQKQIDSLKNAQDDADEPLDPEDDILPENEETDDESFKNEEVDNILNRIVSGVKNFISDYLKRN